MAGVTGDSNIIVFAGTGGDAFARKMCDFLGVPLGKSEVKRFSEGNSFVRILESVRDREAYVVQPIALSPNTEFTELLFWMDAFKRASAVSAVAIMPYFGYAKGDKKDEPRVSIRGRVCAECIELAGADRIVTMDLHSPQVQGFFKKPMDHLVALPVLCEAVKRYGFDNLVTVAPDSGAAKRARMYAAYLDTPVAIGDKMRVGHDESAQVLDVIGDVKGKNALIVDDFTISGKTLYHISQQLKERGCKHIYAALSHNSISAEGAKLLNDSDIEVLISTDTVENPHIVPYSKFVTVSVAPMFAETVIRYYNRQSISPIFDKLPDNVLNACLDQYIPKI